jgi:hypothetical protein
MGPRPADFDEEEIKKSPTFRKWMDVPAGGKLRYACRDFVKGHEDDEERLMRRIMIARRNNVRDHEKLKRARSIASQKQRQQRQQQNRNGNGGHTKSNTKEHNTDEESKFAAKKDDPVEKPAVSTDQESIVTMLVEPSSQQRKRRYSTVFSDAEVATEMDVQAVEATRSYRTWMELPDGSRFVYNQTFTKGTEGHDWMLRKNIWRRMRYRRENKKMMDELLPGENNGREGGTAKRVGRKAFRRKIKNISNVYFDDGGGNDSSAAISHGVSTASQIVDQALLSTTAGVIASIHTATAPSNSRHGHPQDHSHEQHHRNAHEPTLESTAAEAAASIPHDPDTDAVVEAAVAAGESYAISPYVHNPLETSVDGLGLALDAAARLAAAKVASLETEDAVLAAVDAGQTPTPLPTNPIQQGGTPLEQDGAQTEEELGGYVMEYISNV